MTGELSLPASRALGPLCRRSACMGPGDGQMKDSRPQTQSTTLLRTNAPSVGLYQRVLQCVTAA
jgi:hypothetical protein